MNKGKKKAMIVNIIAQCIVYISAAVFLVEKITGKELPYAVFFILMILDVLTIPAFIYAYIKTIENDKA